MNLLDEQAWQREFEHVEEKQKQRETITFANGSNYEVLVKDDNNEK